jgi:phosphatidylglycerophosphate synthase
MFDDVARARLVPVLLPAARWLGRRGLTPSQLTLAALAIALAAAALAGAGWRWPALVCWLASRVGDGLDGVLARETGRSSAWGGYLDITCDMAAYSAMVVAFGALRPDLHLLWSAILVGYVLAITTTLALAGAAERARRTISHTNRTFQFTTGLAEAGETTVVYVVCLAVPAAVEPVAWIWCIVLGLSVFQRSALAWRVLR